MLGGKEDSTALYATNPEENIPVHLLDPSGLITTLGKYPTLNPQCQCPISNTHRDSGTEHSLDSGFWGGVL